jgi:hypothetical protein
MTNYDVLAIDPVRLAAMREAGADEHGNPFATAPAAGWEPLRCCLTVATAGEAIALISYTPFETRSPWAETGPVFVHAEPCGGYDRRAGLPPKLRTGPRILRSYRADRTLDYDHMTYVGDGADIEAAVRQLLAAPGVDEVHVRAATAQCFTFAVRPSVEV